MLFNSLVFFLFFPTFFFLYWFVFSKSLKYQNLLILVSSYIFYGWWDWDFLGLIILSSVIDFSCGKKIYNAKDRRKKRFYLYLSLFSNLGILGLFKYYNFFIENLAHILNDLGITYNPQLLNIILPVGISFYTFQTLSYTIDIYRGSLKPSKDWLSFFCYVAFFPQLVAGPIERASHLLPQFYSKRIFSIDKANQGLRKILWGFFKKLVIADSCSYYVDIIFSDYSNMSSLTLILGSIYFAFQIYADFSGYSDIAIGLSKLLGFDLRINFNYPYFSRNIAEFWRRWHISLSSWFKDYLYIPLGGSRGNFYYRLRNTFIIFLVSGFWHGANWTFIAWGFLNALYYIPSFLTNKNRKYLDTVASDKNFPSLFEFLSITLTFSLVCFAWIFFRANSITEAFSYIFSTFKNIGLPFENTYSSFLPIIILFQLAEWYGRNFDNPIEKISQKVSSIWIRWSLYSTIIYVIYLLAREDKKSFIYFQF